MCDSPLAQDVAGGGQAMHDLIAELYPICRSLTGDGVRQTLECLKRHIDIGVHEVPTGTQAFDWTIPREWNIRDADTTLILAPSNNKNDKGTKCKWIIIANGARRTKGK